VLLHREEAARAHERSRCSTTTSTAPPSSAARPCSTRWSWWASRSPRSSWCVSGAGAAAIACLDVMVGLGLKPNHIYVLDSKGVIQSEARGRQGRPARRQQAALLPAHRRARWPTWPWGRRRVPGLLGRRRAVSPRWWPAWPRKPIILALANPEPEIRPELARPGAARLHRRHRAQRLPEPGQQRPVLPVHLPRRARLRRHQITEAMKLACVREIAAAGQGRDQRRGGRRLRRAGPEAFGPDYIIPKPFDVRLILRIAPAVAQAAADSGVATRPDCRPGRLPPEPAALRLPDRHGDAPGVCRRQERPGARGLRRGRGRARAARRAGGARRGPGPAILVGRPAVIEDAHRARRAAPQAGARLRARRPRERRALPRLLGGLPAADGPRGHHARAWPRPRCAARTR
jgi:hypothetical protein